MDEIQQPSNGGNGHATLAPDDPELRAFAAELRALEANVLLARTTFARATGFTFGNKRDMFGVLGYPDLISTSDYRAKYQRGGIAGRIIDAMPNACWRGAMEIIEAEDKESNTPFEQAWIDLDKRLQIQAKLQRADKLAGLSTYAVIFIGAGGVFEQELPRVTPGPDSSKQILYLTPFLGGGGPATNMIQQDRAVATGADATVFEYETDTKNPRFGLPKSYQLKRLGADGLQKPVHWSRVIHIAENVLDDDVFGLPCLERVWNLIEDLEKVTGGGAEAFWLRANQGVHANINKDMALPDVDNTITKLKEQVENYKHGLDRWLRTRGVDVSVLGSDVANFAQPADAILTQIAGAKSMPKRILTGSEMGELASSQDRDNWKDQINGRQTGYLAPYVVRPLVDRLVSYGYLPAPAKGADAYEVRWPHIQTLTEQEKSTGAKDWAATKVAEDPVFTDTEIRDKWYGMAPLTDEQRQEIADRKAEKLKQQQEAMGGQLLDPNAEDGEGLRAAGGPGSGIAGHTTDRLDIKEKRAAEKVLNQILGGSKASAAVRKKATIDQIHHVKTEDLHRLIEAYETIQRSTGVKSFALDRVKEELSARAIRTAASTWEPQEGDEELVQVLAEALDAGNVEVVARIVGLGDVEGHPFHGNQYVSPTGALGGRKGENFVKTAHAPESYGSHYKNIKLPEEASVLYEQAHAALEKQGYIKDIPTQLSFQYQRETLFTHPESGMKARLEKNYFSADPTAKARGEKGSSRVKLTLRKDKITGLSLAPMHKLSGGTALCSQPTTEMFLTSDDQDVTCVKCLEMMRA